MRKRESIFAKVDLTKIRVQDLPLIHIGVVVVLALILLQVLMFVIGFAGSARVRSLTKKYAALTDQKKQADILKAKVDDINKRSAAIDELMSRRFGWAKKLNDLSDSMTQGIWLTELVYDERPTGRPAAAGPVTGVRMPGSLVLSGYAVGSGEHGTALVGRFIKSLKENTGFYSDFREIELVSAKSERVENQDVMNFRIICDFK